MKRKRRKIDFIIHKKELVEPVELVSFDLQKEEQEKEESEG